VGGAIGKGAHLYLSDRATVDAFRKVVPEENWTPDERAAVNVIERTENIADASPYVRGPAGDHAHFTRMERGLRAAADRIEGGAVPSPARPVAPPPMATMWRAIIGNEGGTDKQGRFLTSPKGAIGPAQVLPGTAKEAAKLAGLPWDDARYRSEHAYNEALGQAYFKKQLDTFGDPAKAAAAYNAGPGSARSGKGLRGAMARAARAGEPDNWEKYLPAETRAYVENFRRRTGIEDGPVRSAELPAMADDIAPAEWADLPDEPVLPDLRRDLFPDEATWRVAQAADEAEMLGIDPRLLIAEVDSKPEFVRATVAQDAAPDEGLGPASILTFQPARGEPGISVRVEDGQLATAVFRDADGVARGAVQYPITAEARETFPEVRSFVQPEFRRQGVATRLYDALEDEGYAVDALSGTGDLTPAGAALVNSRRVRRVERAIEAVTAPRAPVERMAAPEPAAASMGGADPLPARGAARFADPAGSAPIEQAMTLGHDIKASIDAGHLDGLTFAASGIVERNGSAVALPESATVILAELDAEDAALAAIRGCL
jgi:GNAT superfamily N-acetyltransferase